MRTVPDCFNIFIVTTSPKLIVIYSLKFVIINFLGTDFLPFISSHRYKNQPLLGLRVQKVDKDVAFK